MQKIQIYFGPSNMSLKLCIYARLLLTGYYFQTTNNLLGRFLHCCLKSITVCNWLVERLPGADIASSNTIRIPSLSSPGASRPGYGQEQSQSGILHGVEQQEQYSFGDQSFQLQTQFGASDGSMTQQQAQQNDGTFQGQEQKDGIFGTQMQVSYTDKNKTYTMQEQEIINDEIYLDPTQKIKKRLPFPLPFGN